MSRRITYPAWLKRSLLGLAGMFILLNLIFPPPLKALQATSAVVTDRHGAWLAGFTVENGLWRIPVTTQDIDPRLIAHLIAIEDQRFYHHSGVDVPAIFRAALSWVREGEAVSGASTLTMQLVRQLEPRPRTLASKFVEVLRATQLELFLSKPDILEAYLTHVPYGGNLEGVYAASLAYLGKPPHHLTDAEIALLIALPQAPEARRPDLHLQGAQTGRDYVLGKLVERGVLPEALAREAATVSIATRRHSIPEMAWVTAYGLAQDGAITQTTLDPDLQARLETKAARYVADYDSHVNAAITIVENKTMAVRAHIASSDRNRPGGWIDMTRRARSPGSTLKPFIYGMAMDDGLISTASVVQDAPTRFGQYQPENFNRRYYGQVRIYEALRHSLNVPAVAVMDKIGGQRFETLLGSAGVDVERLGAGGESAGLALALGGAGMTVNDLAVLYAGLANGGEVRNLRWQPSDISAPLRLFSNATARDLTQALRQAPTPEGRVPSWLTQGSSAVAYKTGTSYGFRDAWAAGYSDRWTVIVWVGRPDGAPRPGQTGRLAAAPLLFDVFDALDVDGAQHDFQKDPAAPKGLKALKTVTEAGPQILFPPDGAEIYAPVLGISARGFTLSARAATEDIQFYIDGRRLNSRGSQVIWKPQEAGFYEVSAIDGLGQTTTSHVEVISDH